MDKTNKIATWPQKAKHFAAAVRTPRGGMRSDLRGERWHPWGGRWQARGQRVTSVRAVTNQKWVTSRETKGFVKPETTGAWRLFQKQRSNFLENWVQRSGNYEWGTADCPPPQIPMPSVQNQILWLPHCWLISLGDGVLQSFSTGQKSNWQLFTCSRTTWRRIKHSGFFQHLKKSKAW